MSPSLFSLKSLRRRSKASFQTERSTDTSSEGDASVSQGTPASGASTPPSLSQKSDDALNLRSKEPAGAQTSRPAPAPHSSSNNRLSMAGSISGMTGLGSPGMTGSRSHLPISQYAPRIGNLTDGCWAYQKVLLVHGTIGEAGTQRPVDGTLTISRADDAFPPIQWPVCESQWKALVYLQPGPNRLRFDFSSPKLMNSGSSNPIHSSYVMVHMLPPMNAPPLHLAILLGSDSPGTFDAMPARAEREGNGLDTAMRKFRMAAYLWQAFTSEQMFRNKLGRRAFRFDEEWMTGTSNIRDREMGTMRSEAKVHIIRTDKTVNELRDLEKAQQYEKASKKGALFDIAKQAVTNYFQPLDGQKLHVSVLLLDAHWDTSSQVITGHAALGGSGGDLRVGIFGSHCLQSYPSTFEEVVPAFTDCTPTDTNFVANDCNDCGSSWEMVNLGIGAHLHETGHAFGCPHQESGIMLRDYVRLNRSFVAREAYSTRMKSKGGVVSRDQECGWHRLDCLRFRSHPCFRLPSDPPMSPDESVQAWPLDGGNLIVTAPTGVAFVEIFGDGDDVCHAWIEYAAEGHGSGQTPRNATLSEVDLRSRLPENKKKGNLKISVKSCGGGSLDVGDFHKLVSSKESTLKLENGNAAFKSKALGFSQMPGSSPGQVVFSSSVKHNRVLSKVIVFHGRAVDGMEFFYDDDSRQLFGKRGGRPGGDTFDLDVRRGEYITGFHVRSGQWIDGIQILTSMGRRSPLFGNVHGGSPTTLIPPRGFTIVGVSGSCAAWVDGFSVLIAR
ncbi:hypothetical protein MKZ38_007477 [Zalerion maritima]|uniref:Jacalin-type lectin domain-containing protein n=1 Tax=Zalerion maritima TaxID=339359 RepID=A0AAD5RWQ1_9PEZI|nr:hypothetical protein MKZ38_007477 [Zalerion maritima]